MANRNLLSQILLASDFPMLRDSLKAQLNTATDFEVVACANSETEVLLLVASLQPKLVLLDLNIDWDGVCSLLDKIPSESTRTLVMADQVDNKRIIEALQHGACGVLSRRTTPDLLIKSIRTVMAGEFWVSRAIVTELIKCLRQTSAPNSYLHQSANHRAEGSISAGVLPSQDLSAVKQESDSSPYGLTRRERQIIDTVVDGQTNKDVASTLGISEYTVKHHLTNIFDKLGVYNRVELVLYAINNGLCRKPIGK